MVAKISLKQKQHWAALIGLKGVGNKTFFTIEKYLKKNRIDFNDFWVGRSGLWAKIGLNKNIVKSIKKFKREYSLSSYWQRLTTNQASVISWQEKSYPSLLQHIDDKPPILFVRGNLKACQELPIAVIGTRHMTAYGKLVTKKITRELVDYGATIVSGFMYGVDVMAQMAAADKGGNTMGVLGSGFNHIYPKKHQSLCEHLLQKDKVAFISEYPPWTEPTRGTFPRRNRLIAGCSLGLVVTEAGAKSGTQITVGYGLDYGRDVFAVSGPVTSPYHLGVKKMLNQGAMLVSSGAEVMRNLSALNWRGMAAVQDLSLEGGQKNQHLGLSKLQQKIIKTLATMPLTVKRLQQAVSTQDTASFNSSLADLELKGLISHCQGQWCLSD